MLITASGTLPGWRDFERAVAAAFDGIAQENKAIFDVLLKDEGLPKIKYGLSCKMRAELNTLQRTGRVTMELSNSAKAFWTYLNAKGINASNYRAHPTEVDTSILELVRRWHEAVSVANGGKVDISKSSYLVLTYNLAGVYQLHQFSLVLPDPRDLRWYFPTVHRGGIEVEGSRLKGDDAIGNILEWYGESGGQLKYYPLAINAIWQSKAFKLEPLLSQQTNSVLLQKALTYFPDKWPPK